jgi:GTP-binding protein
MWSELMKSYFKHRSNLKCIFHLIDSRHGMVSEDSNVMKLVSDTISKSKTNYVVLLTKSDKTDSGSVPKATMASIRAEMKKYGLAASPVIVTSSVDRRGRDDVWRYLGDVP